MEDQLKILAVLTAKIWSMNDRLDELLHSWKPEIERSADCVCAEVGNLRVRVIDIARPAAAFPKGTEPPPPQLPPSADVPGTSSLKPAVLDPAWGGDSHGQLGHHDASSLREGPPELVPSSAALQGSSWLVSIVKATLGAARSASASVFTTAPSTCSTDCLPQQQMVDPVLVLSSSLTSKEYGLDSTPATWATSTSVVSVSPVKSSSNTGISDPRPPSTREDAQEMLAPMSELFVKSQDSVASRPPRRPPELEAASDQTCVRKPLRRPWPSLVCDIGLVQTESPSPSEDKAPLSVWLMFNGNRSTSVGYIIGNVLCSPCAIWCWEILFRWFQRCLADIHRVQQANHFFEVSPGPERPITGILLNMLVTVTVSVMNVRPVDYALSFLKTDIVEVDRPILEKFEQCNLNCLREATFSAHESHMSQEKKISYVVGVKEFYEPTLRSEYQQQCSLECYLGKLCLNWKFAHSAISPPSWLIPIQSVALANIELQWFRTVLLTESASMFDAGLSMQLDVAYSVQSILLYTHGYQLSILAPTMFSFAWGNVDCISISGENKMCLPASGISHSITVHSRLDTVGMWYKCFPAAYVLIQARRIPPSICVAFYSQKNALYMPASGFLFFHNQEGVNSLVDSDRRMFAGCALLLQGFVLMCLLEEQLLPTWPPPIAPCSITNNRFRNAELPSLVIYELRLLNHQDTMQMQIVWQPSVHACFITVELSYEVINESCGRLYWYHGWPAVFSCLAFDRQGVFQGGRCAMISITGYLALDSYIDYLDSLSSNGLKVLQVPWDPGVCSASLSVGLRASQMLRRGECHGPGGPLHHIAWAASGRGLQALGLRAELNQQLYLKQSEANGCGVEEPEPESERLNRRTLARAVVSFFLSALYPWCIFFLS